MLDTAVVVAGVMAFFTTMGQPGYTQLVASVLLFAYAWLGLFGMKRKNATHYSKLILLCCLIACTVGARTVERIAQRRSGDLPLAQVIHDHPLQNESAVRMLLNGKNPYSQDFGQTELASWRNWDNPAMQHVVALPVTFYKSIPFALVWREWFGWYDDRISHLALLALFVGALYHLPHTREYKLTAVAAGVFNPLFANFFTMGRSDVIFLSFLLTSLVFLRQRRHALALSMLALAVGSKHTAFFIVPFFVLYVWRSGVLRKKPGILIPPAALLALIFLPFLVWDLHAFLEDTASYIIGTIPTAYPINGYGLSRMLVTVGALPNRQAAYPIGLALLALVPIAFALLRHIWRHPTVGNVLLCYVSFLWPLWFLSRFFHDNYMGVVVTLVCLTAILLQEERQRSAGRPVAH